MSITIDIKDLNIVIKNVQDLGKEAERGTQDAINAYVIGVQEKAVQLAPADEGYLRNHIKIKYGKLSASVISSADYSAFLEFGTRKFASSYVATLPSDWQAYAAQFKGSGGGSFKDLIIRLVKWIHRKGITGTYSVKTTKRKGNILNQFAEDYKLAYPIALKILKEGIKPHPFMYPAFKDENLIKQFKERLLKIFK